MYKGIIALVLEAILFLCCSSYWNPKFEKQRAQEQRESILNSITESKCKEGLYSYLAKCKGLEEPTIKSISFVKKGIEYSVAECKIKGEINFTYNCIKHHGTFSTDGRAEYNNADTVQFVEFEEIRINDSKNHTSLHYDLFGEIVVEKLKVGESITIDGIKCVFERIWDSGDWYMKTSKMLTPTQMYKVYMNPKCQNTAGVRFSTERFLLYGLVTPGQVFESKKDGNVHRYAASENDGNINLRRIE